MTTFTPREVRAWALANGVACPRTGKIGRAVVDAYLAANHPDALRPVAAVPAPEPDIEQGDPGQTIVTVTAWHEGWEEPIAQAIADLIAAVEASTRDRVLTELRQHLDAAS